MNYPTETEHEEMAQRKRKVTMKGYLCECFLFFFAVIHPTCKHARKEPTIKRSVDDLDLFDDQRRRSARIINLILSSLWSGFAS